MKSTFWLSIIIVIILITSIIIALIVAIIEHFGSKLLLSFIHSMPMVYFYVSQRSISYVLWDIGFSRVLLMENWREMG